MECSPRFPEVPPMLSLYCKALNLLGDQGDEGLRAQALIGLGNARFTDKQHRRDTDWYFKALDLLGQFGSASLKLQAYKGLAKAAGGSRNNQQALDYVNQALNIPGLSSRDRRDLNHMKLDYQRYLSRGSQSSGRSQRTKNRDDGRQVFQRRRGNNKPQNRV